MIYHFIHIAICHDRRNLLAVHLWPYQPDDVFEKCACERLNEWACFSVVRCLPSEYIEQNMNVSVKIAIHIGPHRMPNRWRWSPKLTFECSNLIWDIVTVITGYDFLLPDNAATFIKIFPNTNVNTIHFDVGTFSSRYFKIENLLEFKSNQCKISTYTHSLDESVVLDIWVA